MSQPDFSFDLIDWTNHVGIFCYKYEQLAIGILKLGLVNFFILYCSGTPKKSYSKPNLASGFPIILICINPTRNKVDHFEGFKKQYSKNLVI